jgi:hypothetical protein
LVEAAEAAVGAERPRLEHLMAQIDAAISDDDDVAEAVKRIMRSVNAAAKAQMFAGDVDELKLLGRACAQASPGLTDTRSAGREILALPDAAITEALAHMAHLDWDALEAIASFMESADAAIEASTEITRRQLERLGGGDVKAAGEVRAALSEMRTMLEGATS